MKDIKTMLSEGQLTEVIKHVETLLRDDPVNVDLNSSLIELLCINGDLIRADNKLNFMVEKNPDFLVGASNLRQLIRAEQGRQDFLKGKSVPNIFNATNQQIQAFMKLRLEICQGQTEEIQQTAKLLETSRPEIILEVNRQETNQLRDLDDTLAGFIEIFGTDGKFYIAQFSDIEYLYFKPVTSLIEQVWRRVDISIKNGPSGEVYLPMVYGTSFTDAEKLGYESDWQEVVPGVVIGVGQKMWFVNDNAMALTEINRLACQ